MNYDEFNQHICKSKDLLKDTGRLRQEALDNAIISFDDCPNYQEGYVDELMDDLEQLQEKYRKLHREVETFRHNPYIWQARANLLDVQKAIALFTLRIKHLEKFKRSLTEEEWAKLFLETRKKAKQLINNRMPPLKTGFVELSSSSHKLYGYQGRFWVDIVYTLEREEGHEGLGCLEGLSSEELDILVPPVHRYEAFIYYEKPVHGKAVPREFLCSAELHKQGLEEMFLEKFVRPELLKRKMFY